MHLSLLGVKKDARIHEEMLIWRKSRIVAIGRSSIDLASRADRRSVSNGLDI